MISNVDIPPEISEALSAYTPDQRATMLRLRAMIFEEAAAQEIGGVEERLKWGQPSYAPPRKSGTPIRLGLSGSGAPALLVHCATTLIADWSAARGAEAEVEGARALIVAPGEEEAARGFISAALTYRRRRAG